MSTVRKYTSMVPIQMKYEKQIRDNPTFDEEAKRIKTGKQTVKRNSLKTKKTRKPTVKRKSLALRNAMKAHDSKVFSLPSSTQATTVPMLLRQNTLEEAMVTPLPSPPKLIKVRFEHVKPKTLIKRNVGKTRWGGKNKRRKTRKKRRKKTRKKRKRRKTRKRKRRRRGGVSAGFLGEESCVEIREHPMFKDCCGLDIAKRLRDHQNAAARRQQHQDNRHLFNHF